MQTGFGRDIISELIPSRTSGSSSTNSIPVSKALSGPTVNSATQAIRPFVLTVAEEPGSLNLMSSSVPMACRLCKTIPTPPSLMSRLDARSEMSLSPATCRQSTSTIAGIRGKCLRFMIMAILLDGNLRHARRIHQRLDESSRTQTPCQSRISFHETSFILLFGYSFIKATSMKKSP